MLLIQQIGEYQFYQLNANDERRLSFTEVDNGNSWFGPLRRIFIYINSLFDFVDVNITETDDFGLKFFFERTEEATTLLSSIPNGEA